SQLCAPLRDHKGEMLGVIQVLNKKEGKESFNEEDEQFLEALLGQLSILIENTTLYQQIQEGKRRKKKIFPLQSRYNQIVGHSPQMQQVFNMIEKVAPTSVTVLIRGETGTGKEMIARAIHLNSPRKNEPFVKVDCTTLPESLLENELFGHEKGAYTGATSPMPGKLEAAGKGTLFIDEIGEMPLPMQGKLLRIFQDRCYEPLGSTQTKKVEARILAATHRNLEEMVQKGKFRQDLYYRIKVAEIHLPPLRQRGREHILALAYHFLDKYAKKHNRCLEGFSAAAEEALVQYYWPGNVRELENCIESAVIFAEKKKIDFEDLSMPLKEHVHRRKSFEISPEVCKPLEDIEKEYIQKVLEMVGWNKKKAAEILNIGRNTLYRKIEEYQ
ncbi:MAG: sigma-54-dependent Fis family transcriptional regulator, partial [Planctomycetota bacterium]